MQLVIISSGNLLLLRLINNDFGVGVCTSLKLMVSETQIMSFISVPVLAKKREAYIWLHCDVVAQTIYSKKIFCYLT